MGLLAETCRRMDNTISLIIEELFQRYRDCKEGELADYIPELTNVDPESFGISVFTTDGHCYQVGDSLQEFTIQSISKAFTYGMVLDEHGIEVVEKRIGVEPSGEAFNSISLDPETGRPLNPMINAGAIASTGMVSGEGFDERFGRILEHYSRFAGRDLPVDDSVYRSESTTGFRNRAIANLLRNFEMLDDPVEEAVEVYFKQCSILVSCRDLAVMASCLANGGVNPLTGERVLQSSNIERVLSVMSTCGMYDYSGEWIFTVGLPAKSGVGGGVMGVLPGQLGVAVFSPRLDPKGNSVRGMRVFSELSRRFNLHLFNVPVISDQVIRRIYNLSHVGSRCQRRKVHHDAVREHGAVVAVIELQGDIFFSALERVIRATTERADETEVFVFDLNRVGLFDEATLGLLLSMTKQLVDSGKRLVIVDQGHRVDHERFSGLEGGVRFYKDLDVALEACEDEIIAAHVDRPLVDELVPFHDFDLFRDLTAAELSTIEGMLEMVGLKAGSRVIRQGDKPDEIYLLAKGSVSIFHRVGEDSESKRRISSFGAGVCFGDIAVVDGSRRSADVWAGEAITCYTLSVDNLSRLQQEFPEIHGKVMRNILLLNIDRLRRSNLEVGALKA